MSETPKCPYCGDRMELQIVPPELGKETYTVWYQCVVCDSTSPQLEIPADSTDSQIEAKARASVMRRIEPENRVLTLAEAQKKCQEDRITWYEPFRYEAPIVFPAYVAPIDPTDVLVNIYAIFASTEKEVELYGKTWRCWLKKPTPKEMKVTLWEN